MHASGRRAGYGIDHPATVTTLVIASSLGALITVFVGSAAGAAGAVAPLVITLGVAGWAGARVATSLWTKRRRWGRLLDELDLTGGETTLDLGCGRGAVLIETARRLTTGRAIGVDRWRSQDQSGNHPAVTRANAEVEGVDDRVEVRTGDVTSLPVDDGSIDLVTAGHVLGSLSDQDRRQAVGEAARVLRPGGRFVALDTARTRALAAELASAGFDQVGRSGPCRDQWPPAWVVTARRPSGGEAGPPPSPA